MSDREERGRDSPSHAGWKGAVFQVPSAGLRSRYPSIGRHIAYTLLTLVLAVGLLVLLRWING